MRTDVPRYPVDRYLVESSKNFEMVNIINDDIWNPEPALKPEDEIILRRLHEMLQTTADDLKILSNELSKQHEPKVQIKTQPTPLDEEFNEKVHIEEIVDAKFHGYKVTEKSSSPVYGLKKEMVDGIKLLANELQKTKVNAGIQVNPMTTILKKTQSRKLGMSSTNVIQIDEKNQVDCKETSLNNIKINNSPAVAYCEYSYEYTKPKTNTTPHKILKVQEMPGINIRSELREQKVLQLDILPDSKVEKDVTVNKNNVVFIVTQHKSESIPQQKLTSVKKQDTPLTYATEKQRIRKVSKMSTCESSGSNNNVGSDAQYNIKNQKEFKIRSSPKTSSRSDNRKLPKCLISRKQQEKRSQQNLDEWKRKLESVYGHSSNLKKTVKLPKSKITKATCSRTGTTTKHSQILNNNMEYIPYSQLTLGGVRVSDIEKELSDIPNKNDMPISPILDRILRSRENSFHKDSPRKHQQKDYNILSTSDENLLKEVIDIEKTIGDTLSNNARKTQPNSPTISSESNKQKDDSYADDFEDEKSDQEGDFEEDENANKSQLLNDSNKSSSDRDLENSSKAIDTPASDNDNPNATYTKTSNLSFKNKVDIFEFVHLVDTQDIATQSATSHKISLKETQTSPRNETSNIQPIRNDLWPTLDPKGELEKMLILEKGFIKQLILDEYGDLFEKNITKPSTSKDITIEDTQKNSVALQKNTQTSPVHVKSIMTSPTKMKTRTTSPFSLSLPIDRQTSPMIFITNEEELKIEIGNEEDLGISINLSSPRFSLRLPQNSRDVLSNLEDSNQIVSKQYQVEDNLQKEPKMFKKFATCTSTSSIDADNSSSEISSLGEIKLKLKRKSKKNRVPSTSDTSSSSIVSKYSSDLQSTGILPLKSEGEVSVDQVTKKNLLKRNGSIGETSAGG